AGDGLVLRVEDLDAPRVVAGAETRQLDDLRWLGLDWDEGPDLGGPLGPYRQSERTARYEAALDELARRDLLYVCDCSRAEIARRRQGAAPGGGGPGIPGNLSRSRDEAASVAATAGDPAPGAGTGHRGRRRAPGSRDPGRRRHRRRLRAPSRRRRLR